MTALAGLRRAGRQPPLPLSLTLDDGGQLVIDQWLRILPGKRLVGRGERNGQPVLAKLFIARGAARHWRRELSGLQALEQAGIASPPLIASGSLGDGGHYLLTAFLDSAQTLSQRWDGLPGRTPGEPQAMALIGQALRSIAALHAVGLMQTDLHLGNFLLHGDQLHVIDGDAIEAESPGQPLSAEQAENNLAIFFAQFDPAWDELIELLLIDYLQVNTHRALNPDRLLHEVQRVRQGRLDDWLGKALRDCTPFMLRRDWWRLSIVRRDQAHALVALLDEPDSVFAGSPLLKDGGSSTVVRAQASGRDLVVKRYNIKGLAHWLKRFWRPSRAWHSWLAAHRLQFLGIATPAPLAMIESRFGPLRRRAWLITDYCAGQDILTLLGSQGQALPDVDQATALLKLFQQLAAARISHGDLKATNLLWHAGQVWLIDLDAMQAHRSTASWQRAWAEDRARFIRNWPANSPLARWLQERLPE